MNLIHSYQNKGIQAILFDLGGVIINIDYELTSKAFQRLAIEDFDGLFSQAKQNFVFDRLETGMLQEEEFVEYINKCSSMHLTQKEINKAWNEMLLDIPSNRIQLLDLVRKEFTTMLLSNTNAIHFNSFELTFMSVANGRGVHDLFDHVFLSHEIGKRKPNRDAFEHVLQVSGFQANQVLFIDDSLQHIESAQNLGIHTIWLQKGQDVKTYFEG